MKAWALRLLFLGGVLGLGCASSPAAPPPPPGVDRDLDGIVAGPQPLTEWQQEGLAAFETDEEEEEEATEVPG